MCYHASVSASYQQLEERYERPFNGDLFPSFTQVTDTIAFHANGFDFPLLPIITQENPSLISCYNWGLIPSFTKNVEESKKIRSLCLNAKAETVFEKPSFRSSIVQKRCLIPATGFFEWQQVDSKTKIPYFIHLKNESIFSLAGIYSEWYNDVEEKTYGTFSILTTEANELMHNIHNTKLRMPAIIERNEEENWLNEKLDASQIKKLLQPVTSSIMEAYTISPLISSRKHPSNVPEVLKPYHYERRDLFS